MERPKSRTHKKKLYKRFWTDYWTPARSMNKVEQNKILLERTIEKLELEKKITGEQKINLLRMLNSSDKENAFIVISVIQSLLPRRFMHRVKNKKKHEQNKNT